MLADKEAQKIDGKHLQAQLSADHPLIGGVCHSCQFRSSHAVEARIQPPVPPIRLIPVERVGEILGFKNSAVLELAARGELPQKIKFGTSRRASARWVEQEIYAYAWALAASRDPVQTEVTTPEAPSDGTKVAAAARRTATGLSVPKPGRKAK